MRYVDVEWRHDSLVDPIRLVSELDHHCVELRKLEFFRDGRVSCAPNGHDDGTLLGEGPIPSLAEINSDPQFSGLEITQAQFEALWAQWAHAP